MLVERCGNRRFGSIIGALTDQWHRARLMTLKLRPTLEWSRDEHQTIIAAIKDGDAKAARAGATKHRKRARDEIIPLLAAFGLKHL